VALTLQLASTAGHCPESPGWFDLNSQGYWFALSTRRAKAEEGGPGRTEPLIKAHVVLKGMSTMPHPPYPDPDSQILKLIVNNAVGAMQSGEVDAEGTILHAAVHAW